MTLRRHPVVHLLLAVLCVFLMHRAAQWGGLWQAVTHPRVDVSLTLQDGTLLRGDYYTTWQRTHFLRTTQGDVFVSDFKEMRLDPARQSKGYPWRVLGLPTLIFFVFLLLQLGLLFLPTPRPPFLRQPA